MTYVQGSPDYGYEGWMGSDVAAMLPYLDIVVTSGCERPTTLLTSPAPLPRFFSIFLGSAEIVRRCTDGAIDLTKLPEEVDCLGRGSNMLPCPISSLAIIRRAAAGWWEKNTILSPIVTAFPCGFTALQCRRSQP